MAEPQGRFADLPDLMSVERWGEFAGLGRDAAWAAVHAGQVPVIRWGRAYRIPKAALARMLYDAQPLVTAPSEYRLRLAE